MKPGAKHLVSPSHQSMYKPRMARNNAGRLESDPLYHPLYEPLMLPSMSAATVIVRWKQNRLHERL